MRELVVMDDAPVQRANPDAGDVAELAKRGITVGIGFGGANWLSSLFPRVIKQNPIIDALATLATAFLPASFRGSIPGGREVADDLAAGMAAAGAVKLVKPYVGGVPGSRYLPAAAGGGGQRRALPNPMPAPAIPRPANVTAIRAPLGIS